MYIHARYQLTSTYSTYNQPMGLSMGQPMGQAPNMGQGMGVPPLQQSGSPIKMPGGGQAMGMGQGPPGMGQGPSNMGQGPPNMGQGPPGMGQGPPNMGQGQPNMGQGPPGQGMGMGLPSSGQAAGGMQSHMQVSFDTVGLFYLNNGSLLTLTLQRVMYTGTAAPCYGPWGHGGGHGYGTKSAQHVHGTQCK